MGTFKYKHIQFCIKILTYISVACQLKQKFDGHNKSTAWKTKHLKHVTAVNQLIALWMLQ